MFMVSKPQTDTQIRLNALRELLEEGLSSTQDELCSALQKKKFSVTQSTISRDLRRIGAIKMVSPAGDIVYRLPEDAMPLPQAVSSGLKNLILDIQHNGSIIVIKTPPGSASLVAHQLDAIKHKGILGTIAGDDTIFIAPSSVKKIEILIRAIEEQFA